MLCEDHAVSGLVSAFQVKAKDFEDCLMATCAKPNKCGGIVTRNKTS